MHEMEPNAAVVKSTAPASDDTFLITWLLDRDAECPLCKYNLRGLTLPRCPECGEALQLGVSLVEPYLKAWIALVVGLLPPAGSGVFFIIIFIIETMRYRGSMNGIHFWGAVGILYIIACIPASIAALAMRRRFQRLEKTTQRLMAAIAWFILFSALIGFIGSELR